jgi:SAM-dependent methyltransferase
MAHQIGDCLVFESSSVSGLLDEIRFRLFRPWNSHLRWFYERLTDRAADAKFGIQTSERVSLSSLGLDAPDSSAYQPLSYSDLNFLLSSMPITEQDVFLDFGSGMGRAVCVAAAYPFRAVIGVEISSELCAIARNNVDRIRPRLVSENIQIINTDATDFKVPPDVTYIYFFNPFRNDVLTRVLDNVAESLQSAPRSITIVFCGTASIAEFERQAEACDWLSLQSTVQLPTGIMGLQYENSEWTAPVEALQAGAI